MTEIQFYLTISTLSIMSQSIYKYNSKQAIFDSTQIERKRLQKCGMIELTPDELKKSLFELGYKISESDSLIYDNTMNENSYKAKSCYVIDIKTKLSFAHVDFYPLHPERHQKLQEFRNTHYGYCHKTHRILDI